MTVVRVERVGALVAHSGDLQGRPDAVEFRARSGQPTIDWLVEAVVTISGWLTRRGVAQVLEWMADDVRNGLSAWVPVASAMPYDALYVQPETPARLVFSSYVRLEPGQRYRLFLEGAVVTSPTLTIVALVKRPEVHGRRRGWRLRGKAS